MDKENNSIPTIAAEGVPSVDTPEFRHVLSTYNIGEMTEAQFIAHLNADKAAAVAKVQEELDEWRFTNKVDELGRAQERAEAKVRALEALVQHVRDAGWDAVNGAIRAALEAAKPSDGSGDVAGWFFLYEYRDGSSVYVQVREGVEGAVRLFTHRAALRKEG